MDKAIVQFRIPS